MIIESRMSNRMHRGKVRDTYQLTDDLLLMVATDRISAFDVVLPNGIPTKAPRSTVCPRSGSVSPSTSCPTTW